VTDKRLQLARVWTRDTLANTAIELEPASADASFRRYLRVVGAERSYIVMDAPTEKEDTAPFIRAATQLLALGLNVPVIFAVNREQGLLLLSDLGNTTYLQCLAPSNADRLYGDALGALVILQAGSFTDPDFFPGYDRNLLNAEMALFNEWFLDRHLDIRLTPEQQHRLDAVFANLSAAALEQPNTWVHRDYHSRNLMRTETHNPGILDFQDAVSGPITYDLVSLLRDCYIEWPAERVTEWAKGYYQLGVQSGLPVGADQDRFLEWFDWMGVQRHLKAIGIFARLYRRDGKPAYLADIPRVLHYIHTQANRYAELAPLNDVIAPLLEDPRVWTQ
jgi:hypothetical protein